MRNTLATLALAATLTAGVSGIAFAQACPPGYMLQGGYCQPAPTPGGVVGGAVGVWVTRFSFCVFVLFGGAVGAFFESSCSIFEGSGSEGAVSVCGSVSGFGGDSGLWG